MSMRMLIDARHPEETRVAVVKGNRIEEFDFESAEHKQLKGNIYLAKVTRVEPSLQAAFVDYGGNRHGFLAFSEIHPDYYQIPKADREALLREEAEHAAEEERLRAAEYDDEDDDAATSIDERARRRRRRVRATAIEDATATRPTEAGTGSSRSPVDEVRRRRASPQAPEPAPPLQDPGRHPAPPGAARPGRQGGARQQGRGSHHLSVLAGRYCVLMPNTSHGGGISPQDLQRRRPQAPQVDHGGPEPAHDDGLIVRTAGLSRTKVEIKRDFDYLARLWDEIRERTLGSTAPALIYRDSDLIKRAIRDLYHRDIDEVIVEGEEGYKAARGFMKLLMPSHVRRVKQHADTTPLFQRYGVEDQLSAMYQPLVQLKSGGYLVINPTEALVSIDINSGRSTREHNIEQTAFATNLEAAAEIARQLRLRDMAGLIVIDFIDMEQNEPCPQSREGDEGSAEERPRAHPGRPHLELRADGDEPPAAAHRRARSLDQALPALRRHRPDAHRRFGRPVARCGCIEDEAARGRGDAASCSAPDARPRSTCSTRSAPSSPRSSSATASRSRS